MNTSIKLSIAARLADKGVNHPIVIKIARDFNLAYIQQDSWVCCGGGELTADLYYYEGDEKVICGCVAGDNGTNKFYNPSGEPWTHSIEDKSDGWHLSLFPEAYRASLIKITPIVSTRSSRFPKGTGRRVAGIATR